jgi:hypothetical protein
LFEKTSSSDKKSEKTDSPVFRISKDEKTKEEGLTIESVPQEADVFIDNRYYGITPLVITGLEKGTYRIRLELENYEIYEAYLSYEKESMTYTVELVRLTGFIEVVTEPADAEVIVGGENIANERARIPVGKYDLTVRLFGYEEYEEKVTIQVGRLTQLHVILEEADFNISELSFSRKRFNPLNTGLLGKTEISFYVTAPGEGKLTIKDAAGTSFFSKPFPLFDTWRQSILWDGISESGSPLPDGVYTVEAVCVSTKGGDPITRTGQVSLDQTAVISYSSLFCGSAGLLFCPTPSVLPDSNSQFSALFTAHGETIDGEFIVRAPSDIFTRIGIADKLELDVMFGLIPTNTSSFPFLASISGKYLFLNTVGLINTKMGMYLRASYHYGTGADTFSNYTGAGFGIPLELKLGVLSLCVTPEVAVSPWKVTYTSDYDSTSGFYSWLYVRSGILVDVGDFSFGASAVFRTLPFDEGFAIDLPVQGGAEIHYLVPDTQFFVSGLTTFEFSSPSGFFFSGGIGLGFVF